MIKCNEYPTSPGTYLAVKKGTVVLCLFVGWFPSIELKHCLNITKMFIGDKTSVQDTDKLLKNSIQYDRTLWKFYDLQIDEYSVLLSSLQVEQLKDITKIDQDEEYRLFAIYCKLLSTGISWMKMVDIIRVRTNCSAEEALNLIKKFDEKRYAPNNRI